MQYCVKLGNSLVELKKVASQSCRCCVTSPPYWGLRDYNTLMWESGDENCIHEINKDKTACIKCGAIKKDDQIGSEKDVNDYVKSLVTIFNEIKRILTDDGTLWLNIGDSYVSAETGSLGKSTGEKYGFNKNHKHSNASLSRPGKSVQGLSDKNLVGVPWRVAFALQDNGWILRNENIWAKPNPMPESVKDRFTKSHEKVFLFAKNKKYFFDQDAVMEVANYDGRKETKTTVSNKYTKINYLQDQKSHSFHSRPHQRWPKEKDGVKLRNKRDVWFINTANFKGAHFAVMPTELSDICVKAGSQENDWVIDPFSGVGTTGVSALKLNRNYLGIELYKESRDISIQRLKEIDPIFSQQLETFNLFKE